MSSIDINDAQADLRHVIQGLNPGEPLVITDGGEPVATLSRSSLKQWPCKAGSAKDTDHWMAPDFDAPLDDFKEYSE
jgi:antitoxin (DNA-binding transcriptional repressor) of toxin-antitoxin stability system